MPGAGNLGDDLISIMLTKHIFERWPQAEIGVLCGQHSIPLIYPSPTQICFLPMPRRQSWRQYVQRTGAINDFVKTTDMILVGGGGLFQDSHYRFTVHKWLRDALHSSFTRIPTAAVGVGFGPFNYAFTRWYLKQGLSRFSVIQVRDRESAKIVNSLGYSALNAPDIVAGTDFAQTPFEIQLEKSCKSMLGCSIRPWAGLRFEALVNLICVIAQTNSFSVRLFVFEHAEPHNTSEYNYSLRIAKALARRGITADVFCYGKQPIKEFAQSFSDVATAIAVRFHANIIWQKLDIPVLPLSYAPKVARLYEERGGRVIAIETIDDFYAPDWFQKIELAESYFLPSNAELLKTTSYHPQSLYALAHGVDILETGYGLAHSAAWRLKQIGKPPSS